jgi:hypothetical protein
VTSERKSGLKITMLYDVVGFAHKVENRVTPPSPSGRGQGEGRSICHNFYLGFALSGSRFAYLGFALSSDVSRFSRSFIRLTS